MWGCLVPLMRWSEASSCAIPVVGEGKPGSQLSPSYIGKPRHPPEDAFLCEALDLFRAMLVDYS